MRWVITHGKSYRLPRPPEVNHPEIGKNKAKKPAKDIFQGYLGQRARQAGIDFWHGSSFLPRQPRPYRVYLKFQRVSAGYLNRQGRKEKKKHSSLKF